MRQSRTPFLKSPVLWKSVRLLFFSLCSVVLGQEVPLLSTQERYLSSISLLGLSEKTSLSFRTLSNNEWPLDSSEHPWMNWYEGITEPLWKKNALSLQLITPTLFNSYNLKTPAGINDGALWQGAGYNGSLSAGLTLKSTHFEATLAPQITFSENKAFTTVPSAISWNGSEWGYYLNYIDAPQRMGDQPFWDIHWGQSELRFNLHSFTLGAGTQNAWIGPTYEQAIILSNNAAGFPKIDMGMNKKTTKIGTLETRFWWGFLKSSSYYAGGNTGEGTPDTYLDFLSGFTFSYGPKFIPGLTVGVHKTAQTLLDDVSLYSLFSGIDPGIGGRDKWGDTSDYYDNRVALTWDWKFPVVGFEFYGEYSREDYSERYMEEPEHSRGLTMGVHQAFDLTNAKKHILVAEIEATSLVWSRDYFINEDLDWGGGYYRHHKTNLGYTHEGQTIGAGMGTGSNTQHFAINYYAPFGMTGIFLNRLGHDDSPIYTSDSLSVRNRPVQLEVGAEATVLLPHHLSINSRLSYIQEYNWAFIRDNDIPGFRGTLSLTYR